MSFSNKTYGLFATDSNKKLISKLESEGSSVFIFPKVFVKEVKLDSEQERIFFDLQRYDWAIFTDVFAVDLLIEKLEEKQIDLFELDTLRVLAFGESVADRLRFSQIHSDIITNNFVESDIFKLLKEYVLAEDELAGLKFLLIKESNRIEPIKLILENAKALVLEFAVYETEIKENITKLKTLIKNGAVDEIIISNPDELFALEKLLFPEKLSEILDDTQVSAKNEITLQTLGEFGLSPKLFKLYSQKQTRD